ncbi:MAG: ATP-binding protein [Deltaproteobacteria bacterium]|nr:ATP-binding protein [Deltaproteobacteria bacterium]TLN04170.1 MAG: ATP-binding protein [bacterium]
MNVIGTIIALVSDAEERAVWEPIFSRMEEMSLLVEMTKIPRVVADLRNRGESVSLVIISTRVYPLAFPKLVSQARQLFPQADIMLMCLSSDPPPLSPLLADNVRHLLINPVGGPHYDLNKVVSLFDLSIRRLKNGTCLTMADYIRPGTPVHEFRLSSSEQKEDLIAELEKSIGGSSHEYEMLRMKGALLVDEMLENAFYAAPRGERAEPLYRKGEKRDLADGEDVVFRYGFDGETLALEVADGWGTLSSEDLFAHLTHHCDTHCVHDEIGGRGLFIIWRFLDTLLVRIEQGKQTVIGGHISLSTCDYLPEIKGFHITTAP